MALRTIIAEWKRRNEVKRIKVAHNVLLLDKSEAMVLDAIRDLNILSQKRRYNRGEMHNLGITKLLTSFLEHKNMMVWTEALKLLRLLVEDEEGKESVSDANKSPSSYEFDIVENGDTLRSMLLMIAHQNLLTVNGSSLVGHHDLRITRRVDYAFNVKAEDFLHGRVLQKAR
ncbi:U-box domain-containing protein 42 [Musa troglodytarum]|uniref:U-box domain-containing protein 42 n=1 Tax=Musa troglodytarum TaxID=320322 RepID=A0A9E7FHG6_9LILI|nr:U-box domain-containing protein 42 [Musa troglodytarum]